MADPTKPRKPKKRLKRVYRTCPNCKARFRTTAQGRSYCCRGCALAAGSRKAMEGSLPHWMKSPNA